MTAHKRRALLYAAGGLLAVWALAGAGFLITERARVTSEKVARFLNDTDLARLSGEARQQALRDLARQMTALPVEERRKARQAGAWERWFEAMSDAEKAEFIEATLPSGFKQMIRSFEQLPEEKRQKAVRDSVERMRKTRAALAADDSPDNPWRVGTNAPVLSEELQQQIVKIGLDSFYSQSSAQTKAEMAPMLEEMQRSMESGALFRRGRRP
jgi:hypothetical protein